MKKQFWSLELKPGTPYYIKTKGILWVTHVALSGELKSGRSTLAAHVYGSEYAVCSLTPDLIEQQKVCFSVGGNDDVQFEVIGENSISLIGHEVEDLDDDDFEAYEPASGTLRFRDPTDQAFLNGFELRHFGLEPQSSPFDTINLRKEEETEEDHALHDNILVGLINSMMNSNNVPQMTRAEALMEMTKGQLKVDGWSKKENEKMSQTAIKGKSKGVTKKGKRNKKVTFKK